MASQEHLPSRFLPELKLASRPALLVLVTLLLIVPGAALKGWQTKPRAELAGFNLPPAAPSLKLDDNSAETLWHGPVLTAAKEAGDSDPGPEKPIAAPGEENAAGKEEQSAPDSDGAYKIPDLATEPPKLETAQGIATELSAPPVFEEEMFRYSQRGETPMIRNWKMLGLQTLLAAALAAAPNPASAEEPKEGQAKKVTLEDLKKSLDSIQKDIDKLPALALNVDRIDDDLKKLKDHVVQLQKEVDSLRGGRTSFYRGPAAGAGQVRLENAFPAEMTVVINQVPYRLAPNESRIVSLPAGPFFYEVPSIQGFVLRQRDVAPNETFTIRVFPQQPPAIP
jgi:hypothetical protein